MSFIHLLLGLRHGEFLLLLSTVDDIGITSMLTMRMILKCIGLYGRMMTSEWGVKCEEQNIATHQLQGGQCDCCC